MGRTTGEPIETGFLFCPFVLWGLDTSSHAAISGDIIRGLCIGDISYRQYTKGVPAAVYVNGYSVLNIVPILWFTPPPLLAVG